MDAKNIFPTLILRKKSQPNSKSFLRRMAKRLEFKNIEREVPSARIGNPKYGTSATQKITLKTIEMMEMITGTLGLSKV